MSSALMEDYGKKLQTWLRHLNFSDNPFGLYEAEAEREFLPFFFVDRPYFHEILGNPADAHPGFLFAERGAGKTATREMVAQRCSTGGSGRRALVVPYVDFTPVLDAAEGDPQRITVDLHMRALIRAILQALVDVPSTYFASIASADDRSILRSYIEEFGDAFSRMRLETRIRVDPISLDWRTLTPRQTLEELARILVQLRPPSLPDPDASEAYRYRSIYILVDRVDESPAGSDRAVDLLLPLVRDQLLLNTPSVGFKFFLPDKVGQDLRKEVDLRLDKVSSTWINWDGVTLRNMVDSRLEYYSDGNIARLEDLCDLGSKGRTMPRLIDAAAGSPRSLLRVCGILLMRLAQKGASLATVDDVGWALAEFKHRLEIERSPGLLPDQVTPLRPEQLGASPVSLRDGLVVDVSGGQVYVDHQQILPPLAPQEFDLLKALYLAAPEIVPQDVLISIVWPDYQATDADEQNLRKLLSRLRSRLEPGRQDRNWRFVRSARGRGYYLSVE